MATKLSDLAAKLLAAAGVTSNRAEEIAAEVAVAFPDLEQARVEFERRIRTELDPALNPAFLAGLAAGAWAELKTGHPGFNPHHFGGA